MENTAFNTLSALSLFEEEIKNSFLFHIPHSSREIPDRTGFIISPKEIEEELDLLTDHASEQIFDVPEMTKIVFPCSRLFCDVERLPDQLEPMFKKGRGYYYSKTDSGKEMRKVDPAHKGLVFKNYYEAHHDQLTAVVQEKLDSLGFVNIIDCHTFSENPLRTEQDQNADRADICLGTDDFHTPKYLYLSLKKYFEERGYSVAINRPYSGTIVPLSFYKKNEDVKSLMIEMNQKLYMTDGQVIQKEVNKLQNLLQNYFLSLGT